MGLEKRISSFVICDYRLIGGGGVVVKDGAEKKKRLVVVGSNPGFSVCFEMQSVTGT